MKREKVKIDKSLSKLMEIRHSGTYSLFTFTYSLNRQVSKGKSREWGNSEERRVKSEKVKIDKSLSKLVDFGGGRWIRTIEGIASRFTVCPLWPLGNSPICNSSVGGAGRRTRTPDLLITNQLLYQLSYTSISATEWILADAAPFVKPEFFIFREEGLLHFKICSPAEKRRPYGRPCGRCSLCGCELLRGERGWYLNGQSVCADCFPAFARAELAPCETVFGMEGEA